MPAPQFIHKLPELATKRPCAGENIDNVEQIAKNTKIQTQSGALGRFFA
jgi:hypothetical protein